MKKQPQVTAITRQNIADAFWGLYKTKPMEQITVKDVIAKAGYNRGTFYEYFPNVQAVLDYVENRLIESLEDIVRGGPAITCSDTDAIAKIERLYLSQGDALCLLFGVKGDPEFVPKFKAVVKPLLYDAFHIPDSANDPRIEILFEFAASAIIASFSAWYPRRNEFPADKFILFLRSLLLNGVVNELKNSIMNGNTQAVACSQ